MVNPHGSFIWYELMTRDPAAARAFYEDVVGWSIDAAAPPGPVDYRMIAASDGKVGGMITLTDAMCDQGARPCWLGYIGVDDVDAALAAVAADGGAVLMPASDIPGVGRIAMVADPQGIPFYVMRGASDEDSRAFQRTGMGHVSWNELVTPDPDAALAFYGRRFGYVREGGMPMGELGEYAFLAHHGEVVGAMMSHSGESGPPGWGFYFRVPDIHEAKARVEAGGGSVVFGPQEVPGGEQVLNAVDPEGVPFGLVAPGANEGERG